jgi:hypothetical protein
VSLGGRNVTTQVFQTQRPVRPRGPRGLAGLKDRVEALGGRIFLDSLPGAGTSLPVELLLTASKPADLPLRFYEQTGYTERAGLSAPPNPVTP